MIYFIFFWVFLLKRDHRKKETLSTKIEHPRPHFISSATPVLQVLFFFFFFHCWMKLRFCNFHDLYFFLFQNHHFLDCKDFQITSFFFFFFPLLLFSHFSLFRRSTISPAYGELTSPAFRWICQSPPCMLAFFWNHRDLT